MNGRFVVFHITLSIGFGHGGFAKHIVTKTITSGFTLAAIGQRLVNGLTSDKLLAQHPHCQVNPFANQRFPTFGNQAR